MSISHCSQSSCHDILSLIIIYQRKSKNFNSTAIYLLQILTTWGRQLPHTGQNLPSCPQQWYHNLHNVLLIERKNGEKNQIWGWQDLFFPQSAGPRFCSWIPLPSLFYRRGWRWLPALGTRHVGQWWWRRWRVTWSRRDPEATGPSSVVCGSHLRGETSKWHIFTFKTIQQQVLVPRDLIKNVWLQLLWTVLQFAMMIFKLMVLSLLFSTKYFWTWSRKKWPHILLNMSSTFYPSAAFGWIRKC